MKPDSIGQPSQLQKTGGRIEVVFERTSEDYAAWLLHTWDKSLTRISRSLSSRIFYLFIYALLFIIGIFFVLFLVMGWRTLTSPGKDLLPIFCGLIVFFVLFVVLLSGVGPKSYPRSLARRAAIRQFRLRTKLIQPVRQRVIFSPDEVIETHLDLRGKLEWILDWKVLDSIELGEQHAFFLTQTNTVLIVPQRAFADKRAFLDFVETAWAFHRRARETSSATQPASPFSPAEERITTRSDHRIVS